MVHRSVKASLDNWWQNETIERKPEECLEDGETVVHLILVTIPWIYKRASIHKSVYQKNQICCLIIWNKLENILRNLLVLYILRITTCGITTKRIDSKYFVDTVLPHCLLSLFFSFPFLSYSSFSPSLSSFLFLS